ncbi:MAG: TolB family protein [Sphingobacteriaceae bacterium]
MLLQKFKKYIVVLLVWICNSSIVAQLPETDLWLIKPDVKDRSTITEIINITNRAGYDNQPSFSKDGKQIYFTSIHEDKQADIYAYQLKSKKIIQLTRTKESEYSPTESPLKNSVAAVTVLQDSSQVIQLMDQKTFTVIPTKLSLVDSVGYYNFLNTDTVLYYKLTDPHSLRFHVISNGADGFLAEHPCRTFKTIDRSRFIYGVKDSISTTFLIYDVKLQKANLYAKIASVNEDMVWHNQYGLLISDGAKILQYNETQKTWNVFYDLSDKGIKKITRFAFHPQNKYLVVVNNL